MNKAADTIFMEMKMIFCNYPICTLSLIESYLNYKGYVDNLAYIMFSYSLKYEKKGKIFEVNHENILNVSLSIFENEKNINSHNDFDENDIYIKEVKKFYGVEIVPTRFIQFREFVQYIKDKLNVYEPIIFQFNLYFIPNRQGYKKLNIDHMIAIIGYDNKTDEYLCIDANENPYFKLSREDLYQGFVKIYNKYNHVTCLEILYGGKIVIPDMQYLKKCIDKSIQYNKRENCGVDAIDKFIKELTIAINNGFSENFDIEDIFKVYKERKTSERVLRNYIKTKNLNSIYLNELINCLNIEGKLWMEIFFILKQSVLRKKNMNKYILAILEKISRQMRITERRLKDFYDCI